MDERVQAETNPQAIALCLSGGGLRATLFHLGVIRALRNAQFNGQMALKAVREVYAVSGGSILAAHFLVNYDAYISRDEAVFAEVEKKLIAFAGRDLRNRVLRRWFFHFMKQNPRGYLLEREYDLLFERRTLGQCYANKPDVPTFHFLSASFTTGELCSFSRTLFERVDRSTDNSTRTDAAKADGLPLSFAVAASSAFPPLFPPIRLTPHALGTDGAPPFNTDIELSDGGVFDNYGIDKFCLAQREGEARPAVLIVSNAGGSFATDPIHQYTDMLSRNVRASDILMRRVGETTLETGQKVAGKGLVLVRIGATLPDPAIAENTQQRFRLVRTDLDRFDGRLAGLLADHGERVTNAALVGYGKAASAEPAFVMQPSSAPIETVDQHAPSADQTATFDRILAAAARRSWRPLFLDYRDFLVFGLWWPLVIAVVSLGAYGAYSYHMAEVQKRKVIADQLDQLEAVRRVVVNGAGMDQIKRVLATAIYDTKDLGMANATISSDQVEQIINTPVVKTPVVNGLPKVDYPQKVYIQFAGELSRPQITALNQALRDAGWKVQGSSGERTPKAAKLVKVRYSGENLVAAQALADALNQSGLPIGIVTPQQNPDIRSDVLEVWISN